MSKNVLITTYRIKFYREDHGNWQPPWSGLTADAPTMIYHAQVTAQNHALTYDERIKVKSVTQAVCDLVLRFGESVHDEDAMIRLEWLCSLLPGDAAARSFWVTLCDAAKMSHKMHALVSFLSWFKNLYEANLNVLHYKCLARRVNPLKSIGLTLAILC